MDCRKCIFATWNSKKDSQLGCSADRLSKLIDLKKAEPTTDENITYYKLKRFCNLYRTKEWELKHESKNLIEEALLEVKSSFGIVVYDIENIENLQKTLDSIEKIDYEQKRIYTVLSSFHTQCNVADLIAKVHETQSKGLPCIASIHNYEKDNSNLRDKECFSKILTCSHFVRINSGSTISEDTFQQIDDRVNNQLEQLTLVEDGDVSIIPSTIVNKEYLNYNDYDLMIAGIRETIQSSQ